MAVRHRFTLLCDYAFIDDQGKHGFLGVFSNIVLNEVPGQIPQFYLAFSVMGDPGEEVTINLVNQGRTWESFIARFPLPPMSDPTGTESGLVATAQLTNVEFPAVGGYAVLITSSGREVHAYDFGVVLRGEPHAENA